MLTLKTPRQLLALAALIALAFAPAVWANDSLDQGLSHFKSGKYAEAAAEFQALVDSFVVHIDDSLAAFAVSFFDRFFDLLDRFILRKHTRDGKEARLHDGIYSPTHPCLLGYLVCIDHIELELLRQYGFLNFDRQIVPDLIRTIDAVEQENTARLCVLQDVEPFQEHKLVTGDKIGCIRSDQVRSLNGFRTKP